MTGSSLNEWAGALEKNGGNEPVVSELGQTKVDNEEMFNGMDLPTYKRYIEPLQAFLERLDSGDDGLIENVGNKVLATTKLWYQLIPRKKAGDKITVLDVTPEELISQIRGINTGKINPQEYPILVSEFLPNEYGGQIVIQDDGAVEVYFGEGAEAEYSTREKPPQYSATNNNPTRVFKYSFDDQKLRGIIYSTIKATGGIPGYYEFTLGRDEQDGILRPIFLDYREDREGVYRPIVTPRDKKY